MVAVKSGLYRDHKKGDCYVLGAAYHSEKPLEKFILYALLHNSNFRKNRLLAIPELNFFEKLDNSETPRFQLIRPQERFEYKSLQTKVRQGDYRHFKGGLVFVLGIADYQETEPHEEFVAYKTLYNCLSHGYGSLWIRPRQMFFEYVEREGIKVPRFEYLETNILQNTL